MRSGVAFSPARATSMTMIRWRTPTCGAASPTPIEPYIVSSMSSISRRSLAATLATGLATSLRRGSGAVMIGSTAMGTLGKRRTRGRQYGAGASRLPMNAARGRAARGPITGTSPPSELVAQTREVVQPFGAHHAQDVVEADRTDALQAVEGFCGAGNLHCRSPAQRHLGDVALQLDDHIRQHGALAAGVSIKPDAGLQLLGLAVEARGDPAGAALGRIDYPALVAPRAEHQVRAALGARPRGQRAARQLRAVPGLAHDVERGHQRLEARLVIFADQVEIRLGRAAAETEHQPVAEERVQRLGAVRQLDRMPHRYLQHAGADLDLFGDGGGHAHQHDRVERRAAPAERIGHPQPVEPLRFDVARELGEAVE